MWTVVESFHIKFCKFAIGVGYNVSNVGVLGECGRYGLFIDYHAKCIKYWLKLLSMPNDRYPKQCYLYVKSLDKYNRVTWATHVKSLLFMYGFGFVWINQEVGDNNLFMKTFVQRLKDCNGQQWYNSPFLKNNGPGDEARRAEASLFLRNGELRGYSPT